MSVGYSVSGGFDYATDRKGPAIDAGLARTCYVSVLLDTRSRIAQVEGHDRLARDATRA
jgi:hypothetical protein